MSVELAQLEKSALSLVTAPVDDVARLLNDLEAMKERIKEAERFVKDQLKERIRESGEFTIGEDLYTIARPKKVKDRDVAATTTTLLETLGGDLERFVGCLSANAYKHGAVKRALEECGAAPETFDKLFETSYGEELDVVKVNLAFTKK